MEKFEMVASGIRNSMLLTPLKLSSHMATIEPSGKPTWTRVGASGIS
jgi:hypothetical protein